MDVIMLPSVLSSNHSTENWTRQVKVDWRPRATGLLSLLRFVEAHPILSCLLAITLYILLNTSKALMRKLKFWFFGRANGCMHPHLVSNSIPLPWNFPRKYRIFQSLTRGEFFDGPFRQGFEKYGNTHSIVTAVTGLQKAVNTADPENIHAILSTRFNDFIRPVSRRMAAQPLIMPGILTLDGPEWHHWRTTFRSLFHRKRLNRGVQITDQHADIMFKSFEHEMRDDGWVADVDVMEYIYSLTLDSATEFMLGVSAQSQSVGMAERGIIPAKDVPYLHMAGFQEKFLLAASQMGTRTKLSSLYWLYDGPEWRRICSELHETICEFMTKIRDSSRKLHEANEESGNLIQLLDEQRLSPEEKGNQLMHLFVAGMDTSACTLGWIISMLTKYPDKFAKLRAAVLETFGSLDAPVKPLTHDTLKTCSYVNWCIQEVLRLYPVAPLNQRTAIRDTVLPVGGGPDGTAPVAVRKGTRVQMGLYHANRRRDIWGDDANEFCPERWEHHFNNKQFVPFSCGQQMCLGMGYSLASMGCTLVRFAQRYDRLEPSPGSNNTKLLWNSVPTPGHGVHLRMRPAPKAEAS